MTFKRGEKCVITRLEKRTDLNGAVVTLCRWNKNLGRWEARCCVGNKGDKGEMVCIRPGNLQKIEQNEREATDNVLHPCIGSVLNLGVRGGLDGMPFDEKNHQAGSGQISLMVFQTVAKIAIELYGDASSSLVLALLLDFIGKDNDSYLIQHALKALVCDTFNSFNMGIILPIQDFSRMETASDYGNLMYSLRKGTLAFIEERQMLLKMTISNMKGSKMKSNRNEASTIFQMLMCGRDDNKSIQCSKLEKELVQSCMGGEVTVYHQSGNGKKIEFSQIMHHAYTQWLVKDVCSSLSPLDARKGSLGKWHRLLSWEKQLTKAIEASSVRLTLDVTDDFDIIHWVEGLISADISTLIDAPGVDTDRRILRLAFFAELLLEYLTVDHLTASSDEKGVESEGTDSGTDNSMTTLTCDQNEKIQQAPMKKGANVTIVGLEEKEHALVMNGMEGQIVEIIDTEQYSILFTNLTSPQVIHTSNLTRAARVPRELHKCLCGQNGDLFCDRCNMMWYCSAKCQSDDYDRHKIACKAMVSKFGLLSLGTKD